MRAASLVLILAAGLAPAAEPKAVNIAYALQQAAAVPDVAPAPRPAKDKQVAAALQLAACCCEGCKCEKNAADIVSLRQQVDAVLKRFSEPVPAAMPSAGAGQPDGRYFGTVARLTLTTGGGGGQLGGKPVSLRLDHCEVQTADGNRFTCGPDCVTTLDGRPARLADLLLGLPANAAYRLTVTGGAATRCEFTTAVVTAPAAGPAVSAPLIYYAPAGGGCANGQCGQPAGLFR